MRQLAISTAFGLVGMIAAVFIVGFVAQGTTSISEHWLVGGAVLVVILMALGAYLAHARSDGAHPWPITDLKQRLPFMVVGGLVSALTWYACYVELAAVWNDADYLKLFLDPTSIPELSSTNERSGYTSDAPFLLYVLLGLVVGAWVTDSALKKKWTE